jgi:hypothetical protein
MKFIEGLGSKSLRMSSRWLLTFVVVVPLLRIAEAECIDTKITTKQAFAASSLVFEGRVTAIEDAQAPGLTQLLTFEVTKVWKGKVHRQQTIYHAVSLDDRVFNQGDRLVVFARTLEGTDRIRVGVDRERGDFFGDMSFSCTTGMPIDADIELARRRSTAPR